MKYIEGTPPIIELTRRNLLVLMAKLDDPDSLRTIIDPTGTIAVRAVENEEHYTDRPPGPMKGDLIVTSDGSYIYAKHDPDRPIR